MGRYKVDQTTGELTLLNPSINDIPIYQGVSGSTMSVAGLVPQAQAGDENKVLQGDGTWGSVDGLSDMTGATSLTDGIHGLVPAPLAGDEDKVLTGDGTWGHKLQIDIVKLNGVYGYIDSGGNFVDFKSQADIDAAVAAARVGTATAADVKEGVTFTNSTASGLTGTFAAQTKSATPSLSVQTITPDSGKYLSSVSVSAISPDRTTDSMIVPQWGSDSSASVPAARIATLNPRVNFDNSTTYGSAEMIEIAMPKGYYIWAFGKSSCCIPTETKTVSSGTSDQTITPTEYNSSRKYVKFLKSVKVNAISPQRTAGTDVTFSGIDSHGPYVYFPYGWYPQSSATYGCYVYMTAAQAQNLHKHTATYTPSANSSASDMGEKHNYRYVDTRTVYNLGVVAGKTTASDKGITAYNDSTGVSVTNGAYYIVGLMWTSTSSSSKAAISSGATTYANGVIDFYRSSTLYVIAQVFLIKTTSTTIKFYLPNVTTTTIGQVRLIQLTA